MKLLSRSEEIILLAVWRLRENAYGVTIREQVSKATGHDWPFGADRACAEGQGTCKARG